MTYLEDNFAELFPRYTDDELERDVANYKKGTGKLYKVLKHFFEEEMYKCHGGRGNSTPMEVLSMDKEMAKILVFISTKPKFYTGKSEVSNVKSFFRNAGRTAQKVSNFPIKEVTAIYEKYTSVGDTIYDPSCGFGSRMSACMLSGRNYIGTDPNPTLCNRLKDLAKWYIQHEAVGNCVIFQQGSEVFNEKLVETVDFAFTSPPYYDLEKYGPDSGQSIIKFPEYGEWLNGFVRPTVQNIKRYLKDDGLVAINTKNMTSGKKHKLFDDWYNIMCMSGLEHVETFNIKQNSKRDYKGKHHTGVESDFGESEAVMVFRV